MKYLEIVDTSRQTVSWLSNDITGINLDSLVGKSIQTLLDLDLSNIPLTEKLNFCNLTSLCIRLNIDYCSYECLDLVHLIMKKFKRFNNNFKFLQTKLVNYTECDMMPYKDILVFSEVHSIIYMNKTFKEIFRKLGYTESQLNLLTKEIKNFKQLIPEDLLANIPFVNTKTLEQYELIKELLD